MLSSPRVRRATGGVAVVVVAAAVVTGVELTRGGGTSYRMATAERADVAQTLTTTGTLSPVDAASLDFQVAGTVAKVRAAVGRQVTAGQTVATLDRSTLKTTLTAAQSTLADDRQRLTSDQDGETSTVSSAASSGSTYTGGSTAATTTAFVRVAASALPSASPHPTASGSAGPGSGSGGTGSGSAGSGKGGTGSTTGATTGSAAAISKDQAAVVAAQHATDVDLATEKIALTTQTKACASELSGSTTTSPTASTSPTPAPLTCAQATAGLLRDQQQVSTDEAAVNSAELTLSKDLAAASKALSQSSGTSSSQHSSGTSSSTHSSSTHSSSTQGSSGSTTTAASASTLASDQATIDQAVAAVATAKSNLKQAVLTAPISGTVKVITIAKGDSVSGSSSSTSPAIEIVGSKQTKATISVTDDQVGKVKTGMTATVTADGASKAQTGRVVAIGTSGTESTSGSVTYPVTVNISAAATALVSGADAAVSISLSTARNVLAVPTSAVHYSGSTAYVETLVAGKLTHRTVKVSTIGASLTEVTSGLTAGQRIVLANLKAAVPSSSTNLTTRRGGTGGLGGGTGGFGGGTGGFGGGTGGFGGAGGFTARTGN